MPRLLSLNSYHYRRGGADVVYFEHDELLRRDGWESAFLAMRHPLNEPCEWERFFVEEIQYGHKYDAFDKLRMAGKIVYSLEANRKLRALLDEFRPDVAHAHNLYHHLSPSVLPVLRAAGIPTVMTAHDLKLACPAHAMLTSQGAVCERCKGGNFLHCVVNRCVKGSFALSALVAFESAVHKITGIYRDNLQKLIVPSRFFLGKFVEWGWPEELLAYVPNFVHNERMTPDPSPGNYFVYFGRLSRPKGIDTLLKAAKISNVDLVIVGTGEMEGAVLEAVSRNSRVRYEGRLSGETLFDIVRAARAVVLPSELYENAPLSVLEGFALGKPAIGARIGGIPELVQEGVTGWLFESGNVEALANTLRVVAEMPQQSLRGMGVAARRLAERDFSPQAYLERIYAVYRTIGVDVGAARGGMGALSDMTPAFIS